MVFTLGGLKNFVNFTGKIYTLTHSKPLITCNSHSDKPNLKMHSLTKNLFRYSVSVTDLEQTRRDLIINNFAVLLHFRIT